MWKSGALGILEDAKVFHQIIDRGGGGRSMDRWRGGRNMVRSSCFGLQEIGQVCNPQGTDVGVMMSDDPFTRTGVFSRLIEIALHTVETPVQAG